jgi:hypothetical protein
MLKQLLVLNFAKQRSFLLKTIVRNKANSKETKHDYAKTLNLPNFGIFELSMKNICTNEEKIKKV